MSITRNTVTIGGKKYRVFLKNYNGIAAKPEITKIACENIRNVEEALKSVEKAETELSETKHRLAATQSESIGRQLAIKRVEDMLAEQKEQYAKLKADFQLDEIELEKASKFKYHVYIWAAIAVIEFVIIGVSLILKTTQP